MWKGRGLKGVGCRPRRARIRCFSHPCPSLVAAVSYLHFGSLMISLGPLPPSLLKIKSHAPLKGFLTFHHLQSCSLLDPLLPKAFSISIFLPEPTARSHSGFPDSRFRVLLPSATYLLPESFPRILFLLAPPESTFRFHQNFLPFSLLFPESFSSQKSIPKPLSWDPSPHILFFSESLSTQGPCFSLVVPPRIFLFSGSTTPGNRLLPNLSSQPTVPRTTP